MRLKPLHASVGTTTACTLQLAIGSCHYGTASQEWRQLEQSGQMHVHADSWFGAVNCTEAFWLIRKKTTVEPPTRMHDYDSFIGDVIKKLVTGDHEDHGHEWLQQLRLTVVGFRRRNWSKR
jgi:hypothetical protein